MLWKALTVCNCELACFLLSYKPFKDTHVFEDFTFTVTYAMIAIEPVLENTFVRVNRINYRVCIALSILCKDWYVTKRTNFEEEFAKVGSSIHVDVPTKVFILWQHSQLLWLLTKTVVQSSSMVLSGFYLEQNTKVKSRSKTICNLFLLFLTPGFSAAG